jgi:hypothetical protein
LGSSPLESADSGGRAEIGSLIEIRADMGQNSSFFGATAPNLLTTTTFRGQFVDSNRSNVPEM